MKEKLDTKLFRRHFTMRFRNGYPPYFIDAEGNMYVIDRIISSKATGKWKNLKIDLLLIKKAGGSQTEVSNNVATSNDDGKFLTLTPKSRASSRDIKSKDKNKGKRK